MPTQNHMTVVLVILASLLTLLALAAGTHARRNQLPISRALVIAILALLACTLSLEAFVVGWASPSASLTILELALLFLTFALGRALLVGRQAASGLASVSQTHAAVRPAQELETLMQERNAELSARLEDLGEARRSAEAANLGLRRALDQLEQVASTDQLTGAWNRRRFEEAVLPEIALAHRRRDPLALLMFDLDHFKRVNDTFGHGAGDMVLASVAKSVRTHLRLSDALIRWGGEEFLVMAPATRLDGAMGLAEKLRASTAAIEFPKVGHVTMSVGVSEYALGEGLKAWIERTDQALYRAKAEGRNRVVAAPVPERQGCESWAERSLLEMVWEDTYACGHALVDSQQRNLFHLASALMSMLTESHPLPEVSLRLETLLAHTAQHFHDEESLLREAGYQDLPKHTAVHAALLEKAGRLRADVLAGQLDFGKLVGFLALDLIKGHLLTEDRSYFAHLQAHSDTEGTSLTVP
jgi:diguanylate cyclase (GGDEF)-like protein/hemerythrin-like metal-binding protein